MRRYSATSALPRRPVERSVAEIARMPASGHLAAFTVMYRTAFGSRGIAEYAESLPPDEARWYRLLGELSDAELEAWGRKRFLAPYLEAAGRIRLRGFAMLAFGYLHVAYDFPRFIADSFPAWPELSRERRYRAYAGGARSVWETFVRQSKRSSSLGIAGAVMRLLPGDRPAARLAAGWFLAHRCAAWTAAEALAAADNRPELEERLWAGIVEAGRTRFRLRPLQWIKRLPFSCDLLAPAQGPTASEAPP